MQFTDIIFAVFLFVVFSLYWLVLRRRTMWQNVLLLAASYLFYGWWDWRFLGLIGLTTVTTYVTALYAQGRYGRLLTAANIILNLGILVLFKYFNFFSENLGHLLGLFGFGLDWFTIDVLLPVGISFYTFQAISYSVDVYKRSIRPCGDAVAFATFIAYFPQLVAGPIERASQLLTQIERPRTWDSSLATSGMRLILFGLLKKVCVADMLALYVDRIFGGGALSSLQVLSGGVLFSLEIYCDFSAYSEIARGVSRLLGIELMANFKFPYFARNVIEFWRRWHISLMHWFRDYLYIPLGGNRRGRVRTAVNTAIVFLLSGLWHGAAWNFVVWGAYWAVVYIVAKFVMRQSDVRNDIGATDASRMILTFGAVALGFYFFRCSDSVQLMSGVRAMWVYPLVFVPIALIARVLVRRRVLLMVAAAVAAAVIFGISGQPWYVCLRYWWAVPACVVAVTEWRARNSDHPLQRMSRHAWARMLFYWICICCMVLSEPTEMTFIYFQF